MLRESGHLDDDLRHAGELDSRDMLVFGLLKQVQVGRRVTPESHDLGSRIGHGFASRAGVSGGQGDMRVLGHGLEQGSQPLRVCVRRVQQEQTVGRQGTQDRRILTDAGAIKDGLLRLRAEIHQPLGDRTVGQIAQCLLPEQLGDEHRFGLMSPTDDQKYTRIATLASSLAKLDGARVYIIYLKQVQMLGYLDGNLSRLEHGHGAAIGGRLNELVEIATPPQDKEIARLDRVGANSDPGHLKGSAHWGGQASLQKLVQLV